MSAHFEWEKKRGKKKRCGQGRTRSRTAAACVGMPPRLQLKAATVKSERWTSRPIKGHRTLFGPRFSAPPSPHEPGPPAPQWHSSTRIGRPVRFMSSAKSDMLWYTPQLSSLIPSNPKSTMACTPIHSRVQPWGENPTARVALITGLVAMVMDVTTVDDGRHAAVQCSRGNDRHVALIAGVVAAVGGHGTSGGVYPKEAEPRASGVTRALGKNDCITQHYSAHLTVPARHRCSG